MSEDSRIEKKKKERERGGGDDDSDLMAWIIIALIGGAVILVGYFTFVGSGEVEVASEDSFEGLESLESAEDPTLVAEGTTQEEAEDMVEVVYYGDYGCPFCARYDRSQELEELKENYIETGEVKFTARMVNFVDGQNSQNTALADRKVWNQNPDLYWRWHKTTFLNQGRGNWATPNKIKRWSEEVGLNGDSIASSIRQREYSQEVRENVRQFQNSGGRGTPTLVIGGTPVNPLDEPERVESLIEEQMEDQ